MISIRKVKIGTPAGSPVIPQFKPVKQPLFHFSQKVDYGLFLMIELAKSASTQAISLRLISQKHQLSFFFLQKIANNLRKAGLIQAERGKNGGYALKKSTKNITLKEVLEALEGPIAVMHCLAHGPETQSCVRESWCSMKSGLNSINQVIINALTQTTLDRLLPHHA